MASRSRRERWQTLWSAASAARKRTGRLDLYENLATRSSSNLFKLLTAAQLDSTTRFQDLPRNIPRLGAEGRTHLAHPQKQQLDPSTRHLIPVSQLGLVLTERPKPSRTSLPQYHNKDPYYNSMSTGEVLGHSID